ncbi:MAG: signal peptidase I [Deltaproteobacteria bacterium]|nr:signal peptidase I [Deltaproteobacteria bacterium]
MNLKQKNSSKKESSPPKSRLRENTEALVIAILLALFIRAFIVQAFKIPSGSMKQTLQIGDHILANKFIYGVKLPYFGTTIIPYKKPQRGDIVIFKFPQDPKKDFIKRTIGIPGDVIEIRNKEVYVNKKRQEQHYAVYTDLHIIPKSMQPRDNFGPITVPENSLFVMGDNRDHSYDSRFWGFVDLKDVKGKAFIIYWSWDKENFTGGRDWLAWWNWVSWNRIGKILK